MAGERDVTRLLGALALPTFALALAMSVLTTYAPLLLGEATSSSSAIGLAIGGEGLFALFLVGMLVPTEVTIVPLYFGMREL